MRIWLFRWDEPLPFDQSARLRRAGLLANQLIARGHEVVWWTSNFNHFAKKHLYPADAVLPAGERLKIVTLKCPKYKTNTSLIRFFSQGVMARHFRQMNPAFAKPDLLIVHYPSIDLAYSAVKYAKRQGIPVIVDVRDMWPDTFVRIFPKLLRPVARLLLSNSFRMKQYAFQKADVLLAMSDGVLQWATQSSRRKPKPADQVFYLGAPAASQDTDDVQPAISTWLAANQDKFVCVYIGTFGKSYNLLSVVRAAKVLQDNALKTGQGNGVVFVLAGDGPTFPIVQAAAAGLDAVFLPGWINSSESAVLLHRADAALIPINDTTPEGVMCNKLFDYAAAGRPIISSVDGEMREFIARHVLGLYFQDDQEQQLIQAIEELRSDPVRSAEFAANSRLVFDQLLNADRIYSQYAELAEQVQADLTKDLRK